MTCRDVTGFLADYVAGDVAPDVRAAFEGHLAVCANCRTFLQQYGTTMAAAAGAWSDAPVPTVPEELVRAVRASIADLRR